jgi:LPS sulfotransferase NodH
MATVTGRSGAGGAGDVKPERSYLVCSTPRSGSTLVCEALAQTGVAGRPEEYFEALRHSGRPRRPEEYFRGVADTSILDHLNERVVGDDPPQRSPLWSRSAYDRYLDWVLEAGTTDNGVFGAKLMWGYLEDFTSLLRNIPEYRELPLAELLPEVFPDLRFIRVVRANKVRQAVSLWKAVQTAAWSEAQDAKESKAPPYKSFLEEQRPGLRFHYRAIEHLLQQILWQEAFWDTFFEHTRIKPIFVLYENFAGDFTVSTERLLERLEVDVPDLSGLEPPLRQQSDSINDDWVRRYSDLKLGQDFDLVPTKPLAPS